MGSAFDQSTKELYVAGQSVVDVFSSGHGRLRLLSSATVCFTADRRSQYRGGRRNLPAMLMSGSETEGKSVVDVFDPQGGLIPPEWEGASTRTGSFGVDSVAVGIDPSDRSCVRQRIMGTVSSMSLNSAPPPPKSFWISLPGPFSNPTAVAVAPPGGPRPGMYVGDYHEVGAGYGSVEVYKKDLYVPTVSKEPVAKVEPSSVELEGTVNPEKLTVTSCVFK